MKKKTKYEIQVLLSFLGFFVSFLLLFGIMGALECDTITIGQAIIRAVICLIVLGADALWINILHGGLKNDIKMQDMPEILDHQENKRAV